MFKSTIDPKKLETLIEINNLINANYGDLNDLFTKILESATKLTDSEASSLLLVDSESDRLHFIIALGAKGQEVKSFTLKMGEGIAGWVAENNTSLIVHDVEGDSRFFDGIAKSVGFSTRSILAVPMRAKGQCVGVLEMINKRQESYFDQDDLTWLEIFATQAGIALQNARSFQEVKKELLILKDQLSDREGYHPFLYKSQAIGALLELTKKFAQTSSSVLILGESGVGKELFAEQIHLNSPRASGPFIRVNCASIPDHLLESELFGHVKGAFTDSHENKKGRFEMANGGTILLDEIGEMPMALQAKILRVLQSKVFERVGGTEPIKSDVRVIASTNVNLKSAIETGRFRSDLYYRLNVLPLEIPPLRERPEDIGVLSDFFLKKFALKNKKPKLTFTSEAIQLLNSYSWPGNIRELENTIERAVVLSANKEISAADLHLRDHENQPKELAVQDLKAAINLFKAQYIKRVLEENEGNQTKASSALGIQRTYLSKLLKELEIEK